MSDSPDNSGLPPWDSGDEDEAKPSAAELEAAGQNAMFGDPAPAPASVQQEAAPAPVANQPYRVLARKYRPQTFSELIGQEPMVQTLSNAIARDRLAHAFLMTGVRGVGKTSTARLIAKALNCVGPDGEGGPTINPCGVCEPCKAIAEGRHIDVIEMDAASHTGVDDVREIIEAVRYAAVSARYKIYIIDEVHMLSRNAFNALLKTLEEPPAHVKFLFATTEVDKLPVTVLSRTQRFDLRRIPSELLARHFAHICELEGVKAEDEAIALVASAAEGSVRDGLSILDQAIAHADMDAGDGETKVTAAKVQSMLGLADRGARRRLFEHLLKGEAPEMLAAVDGQYALGVEPLALIRSLMEFTHKIALAQVAGGESDAPIAEEREAVSDWAGRLSPGQVHRLWQLLLKGHEEVARAPDPLVAAQMALLRVLHAADMPDPGKLARQLQDIAASGAVSAPAGAAPAAGATASAPALAPHAAGVEWAELVDRVDHSGALIAASTMRDWVRVISLAPGELIYQLAEGISDDPSREIREALVKATGGNWRVELGEGNAALSLTEQAEAEKAAELARVRAHPLVKATLEAFPGAEFVEETEAPRGHQKWSQRG
ncbi:DNA polymerase III subunit gamma/tau [Aurantiacibacter xanthus]|uniref:DNA polymerase III subunit gamma/tau n=1 Tax=Aurantiacibacter xanthus TaxID=1784712 RepID=A0A3A1P7B8_9SPHN|nr:DNA polymerase III subunit gamma/tau [Aurantiacibacter xanthus]RIV89505.1 DNA polymerase III subunit gamma/tau [Aurantiacibacter xanthus]